MKGNPVPEGSSRLPARAGAQQPRHPAAAASPRISLSLPVYNGDAYLGEAISSILGQTFNDFELVITDNASIDATEVICRDFARRDRRVHYLRNRENLGAGANFNLGFTSTSAPYFKWCAHDDLLNASYLEACVAALDAHPEASTAYGSLRGIDARSAPTGYSERIIPGIADPRSPLGRFSAMIRGQYADAAIFGVHRRSSLSRTSLLKSYYGSDCALLAELALLGPLVHVPDAVLHNREHPARSVRMTHVSRNTWQASSRSRRSPPEFTSRICHLVGIACRHPQVASPLAATSTVTAWIVHPSQLARLALDLLGLCSPHLRARARQAGVTTFHYITRKPRPPEYLGREH
jgi:hypothetical protein